MKATTGPCTRPRVEPSAVFNSDGLPPDALDVAKLLLNRATDYGRLYSMSPSEQAIAAVAAAVIALVESTRSTA